MNQLELLPDKNFEEQYNMVLDAILHSSKLKTANREFFEKILDYADGDFLCCTPWTVSWKVISACNLRCKHCYFDDELGKSYNTQNDLNGDEIIKLANDLVADFGIVNYSITGGESLLRKDIFEIIKIIKASNAIVSLQTNGTLITKPIAKKLSDLLNPNTDFIQISLDGLENTHDSIRGEGNFKKAINGIKLMVDSGIKVNVNCTPISKNINELVELYRFCTEIGINKFSLSRFIPYNKNQKELELEMSDLIEIFATILTISKSSSTYLEFHYRFFDFVSNDKLRQYADIYIKKHKCNDKISCKNVNCHKHNTLFIDADGKFYLCFSSKHNDNGLGDFRKHSVTEIWNNRNQNIFFTNRLIDNMPCKTCKYFAFCKGGCPASAHKRYNDKNYPDGLCKYAETFIK